MVNSIPRKLLGFLLMRLGQAWAAPVTPKSRWLYTTGNVSHSCSPRQLQGSCLPTGTGSSGHFHLMSEAQSEASRSLRREKRRTELIGGFSQLPTRGAVAFWALDPVTSCRDGRQRGPPPGSSSWAGSGPALVSSQAAELGLLSTSNSGHLGLEHLTGSSVQTPLLDAVLLGVGQTTNARGRLFKGVIPLFSGFSKCFLLHLSGHQRHFL